MSLAFLSAAYSVHGAGELLGRHRYSPRSSIASATASGTR